MYNKDSVSTYKRQCNGY